MLRVRYQLLLLAFVVLGVYYPVIFAPFCSTDDARMIDGLLNVESYNLSDLFLPHGRGQYYRPLLSLSFIADRFVWGLEPSFMHLENLVLHLCNALLVFGTVRMLLVAWKLQRYAWSPLLAALLFALHPVNTEAVAWVSGRSDIMACLFVLLSLWLVAAWLNGRNGAALVASGCALLLGALCKETALFFAPAAVFLVLCHDHRFCVGRSWQQRCKTALAPVLAIASSCAVYLVLRGSAFSANDKGVTQVLQLASAPSSDVLKLVRVVAKLTGFYLKKLFMPLPLNFGIVEVSNYYVLPGALFLILLCYLFYKRSLGAFLAIAGFCTCTPCFFVAVTRMSWTPVAERYLYIPCAMFSMVLIIWGMEYCRRTNARTLLTVACSLVLGGSAYATTTRAILWQDNYNLFADTAVKSPTFNTAKNDMAVALLKRGDKEEAFRIFKTVRIENFQLASLNLANVLMAEGNLTEARKILYERVKGDSGYNPEILKMLVKIAERRLPEAVTPKETLALNEELKRLIAEQYRLTKDPFYQYRMGLVQLRFKDRRAAYGSFSSAKAAAPAGSYYRQPAILLADKFRP